MILSLRQSQKSLSTSDPSSRFKLESVPLHNKGELHFLQLSLTRSNASSYGSKARGRKEKDLAMRSRFNLPPPPPPKKGCTSFTQEGKQIESREKASTTFDSYFPAQADCRSQAHFRIVTVVAQLGETSIRRDGKQRESSTSCSHPPCARRRVPETFSSGRAFLPSCLA